MTAPAGLDYADLLARVDLFSELDRVTLAKLAARLHPIAVPAGATLFHEGDQGDAFYLVARGVFGVYTTGPDGAQPVKLASLGAGAPFGEVALLTNRPRSATIRAEADGEVLRLERAEFLELVGREAAVGFAMAASLGRRLAETQRARAQVDGPGGRPALTFLRDESPDRTGAARHGWEPGRIGLGAFLGGLALVAAWMTPPPAGLPAAGWHALGTLAALLPLLALDVLPEGVLALLLPAIWVIGGIASPATALSGFASPSWVLVVSVLAIGVAVASCGVLYRLALWLVAHARGGFAGQALAIATAGVLVGPAVPNATGRVALIAPALTELVEALGYAPRSRAAAGLALAALAGFGQSAAVFLTSSTTAVLVFAVLPAATRQELTWVGWAWQAAPASVLLLGGLMGAILWLYRPDAAGARATRPGALAVQRALLGPPTRAERLALLVGGALLLGFVTQPLHRIDPGWLAALALGALAVGRVVTVETLRGLNWSFALFFGMLASLSEVLAATRVDQWLAGLVAGVAVDLARAPVAFVTAVGLLGILLSLVLRWQAAAPLLTIALAPIAEQAGINPFVIGLAAVIAANGFLVSYQSTIYLALYHGTEGRLFTHAQARRAALAYALATLVALAGSVPAWRAMGLL